MATVANPIVADLGNRISYVNCWTCRGGKASNGNCTVLVSSNCILCVNWTAGRLREALESAAYGRLFLTYGRLYVWKTLRAKDANKKLTQDPQPSKMSEEIQTLSEKSSLTVIHLLKMTR